MKVRKSVDAADQLQPKGASSKPTSHGDRCVTGGRGTTLGAASVLSLRGPRWGRPADSHRLS